MVVQRTGPIREEVEKSNCTSLIEGDCAEKGQTVEVGCGEREQTDSLSSISAQPIFSLLSLSPFSVGDV